MIIISVREGALIIIRMSILLPIMMSVMMIGSSYIGGFFDLSRGVIAFIVGGIGWRVARWWRRVTGWVGMNVVRCRDFVSHGGDFRSFLSQYPESGIVTITDIQRKRQEVKTTLRGENGRMVSIPMKTYFEENFTQICVKTSGNWGGRAPRSLFLFVLSRKRIFMKKSGIFILLKIPSNFRIRARKAPCIGHFRP